MTVVVAGDVRTSRCVLYNRRQRSSAQARDGAIPSGVACERVEVDVG